MILPTNSPGSPGLQSMAIPFLSRNISLVLPSTLISLIGNALGNILDVNPQAPTVLSVFKIEQFPSVDP